MKDVISVDKILKYLAEEIADQFGGDYDDNPNPGEEQRAKASLHSLLISKLPEKTIGAPVDEYETGGECGAYADGFNQAIDNMRKSIDEMFRSGDENS